MGCGLGGGKDADPRRLTHNHAHTGAVIGGWLSGIGWTRLETEEAPGELGVSGGSRSEVAQDHREGPHMGETTSITFGRTERLGLSVWAPLPQSTRNNTPNMQSSMYTPSPDLGRGVHVTAYITMC